jgi:hypothetical protein
MGLGLRARRFSPRAAVDVLDIDHRVVHKFTDRPRARQRHRVHAHASQWKTRNVE